MATLNLGRIKPVFRGAYNNSTAYVVDDIVTSSGSSYICIQASTGNATSNASYWTQMAAGGTDVGLTLTTQGDILYRDGSGLQRLAKGTAGQALKMNSSANAPEWGTISSGEYSVHKIARYHYPTDVTYNGQTDYIDIAGGNTINFTPTSTNDYILFSSYCDVYTGSTNTGVGTYVNMGTSSSLGSGDTKLNKSGQHSMYINATSFHHFHAKTFTFPCTSLTPNTTYYFELAGEQHNSNNATFNNSNTNNSSTHAGNRHYLEGIHFKKN